MPGAIPWCGCGAAWRWTRTAAAWSQQQEHADPQVHLTLWKECFDEGGLAWDDSNNNRAFLSQEISLTGNAPSIYVAARQKFPDVYKGTNHGHYPPGPAGRFYWLPVWNSCVMKYSKNQKVAKDFIRYYMDRPQYDRYFEVMDTFGIPGTKVFATAVGQIPRPRSSATSVAPVGPGTSREATEAAANSSWSAFRPGIRACPRMP
jgi:ABC-type glycerol-3-phosphate transport system substrate-binding protein